MNNQALKLFNVEIRKLGRGYSVLVTDENRNPVMHPVKIVDFEQKLEFYEVNNHYQDKEVNNSLKYTRSKQIYHDDVTLKFLVYR